MPAVQSPPARLELVREMRELMHRQCDQFVSSRSSRCERWCGARSDAKRYRWAVRSQSQIAACGPARRQMSRGAENRRPMNHCAQAHVDKNGCRWSSTRLSHSSSTSDGSHDELTSVVEHSERESHLTPPLDALQWTIFGSMTIQRQNRWIKITRVMCRMHNRRTRIRTP